MLGNHENAKNCVSQHWESPQMLKIAFPNIGKTENCQKLHFPKLGRLKNSENCISQHWENQKLPKTIFPNIGKAIFL